MIKRDAKTFDKQTMKGKKSMTTGKALNGMPYTGNPHVRFDDGEVVPAAVPRDGSSLCKRNTSFVFGVSCALWLAIVSCLVQSASAGTAFETQTGDTSVYTFGSPVGSGEEGWGNIGETTVNSNRFAFRSGTVNVKSGGYVRVNGYDTGDRVFSIATVIMPVRDSPPRA